MMTFQRICAPCLVTLFCLSHEAIASIIFVQQSQSQQLEPVYTFKELSADHTAEKADDCSNPPTTDYNLGLHVAAIFIILFTSGLGVVIPLLGTRFEPLHFSPKVMRVLKSFGSGVILATAFIHMLYPALEILSSPCLPAFFTEIYPAFAIVLALFAILLMQLVDIFGTHFRLKYRRRRKSSDGNGFTMDVGPAGIRTAANETGNGNGELKVDPSELCDHEHHHIENHNHHHPSHPQHNHSHSHDHHHPSHPQHNHSHSHDHHHSSHTQHNHVHHHDRHNSGSLDEETQLDGNHGDGCCQTAAVVAMMSSGDDCPDVLKSKKWNLYLLETVIGIHSVIIGFALGVKRETAEFTTLLIALVFHQFFEGFALGTLASALHLQPRILITLILVYCLTTPVGTAIGVILTAAINPNPNDVASLVVTGVLDSLAAGILIYTAIVEVIIPDFRDTSFQHLATKYKIASVLALWLGVIVMSVIGFWA